MNINKELMTWEEAVLWLCKQPEQQELVKHCYYDNPLVEAAERFRQSEEWEATCQILKPSGKKVLEIGAGRGIASYSFAREGSKVIALEPDSSDVVGVGAIRELASTYHLPITAIQGCGESLPLEDNSIDVVYARAVLHHAKSLEQLFLEAARVLKPGGVFFAVREHLVNNDDDLKVFLNNHPLHRLFGGEYAYRMDEYLACIKKSGLKIKKIYGPFDTVVNYAPGTIKNHREIVKNHLTQRIGKRLTRLLMRFPFVIQKASEKLSASNNHPGRLCAFLLVKHLS